MVLQQLPGGQLGTVTPWPQSLPPSLWGQNLATTPHPNCHHPPLRAAGAFTHPGGCLERPLCLRCGSCWLQAPPELPGAGGLSLVVTLQGQLPPQHIDQVLREQACAREEGVSGGWGLPKAAPTGPQSPSCMPALDPAASLRPSGSMLLMFSTAMRLLTSLLMLCATPGYCGGEQRGPGQAGPGPVREPCSPSPVPPRPHTLGE